MSDRVNCRILYWLQHYRKRRLITEKNIFTEKNIHEIMNTEQILELKEDLAQVTKIKAEYFKVDRSDYTSGPFLLRSMSRRFRPENLHTISMTATSPTLKDLPRRLPYLPVGEGNLGKLKWKIRLSDTDFRHFVSKCPDKLIPNSLKAPEMQLPFDDSDEASFVRSADWEQTAVVKSKKCVEWLNGLLQPSTLTTDEADPHTKYEDKDIMLLSFIEVTLMSCFLTLLYSMTACAILRMSLGTI